MENEYGKNDFWRRANADWDRLIEKQITDLHWEIDKNFIEGRRLDYELDMLEGDFGQVYEFETELYPDASTDVHELETQRLEGLSLRTLDRKFRSDCLYFAKWIGEHKELPPMDRQSMAQFIRKLPSSNTDALKSLQAYIDQINTLKKESQRLEDQYYCHMALHELSQGMVYLKGVLRIWRRKQRQSNSTTERHGV